MLKNTGNLVPLRDWLKNIFDENPPQRCIFRVDAGRLPGLSFGHLARCLILSRVIRDLYHSDHLFLMRSYIEGTAHAESAAEKVVRLDMPFAEEGQAVMKQVARFQPDWVIVDLPYPELQADYFSRLRNQGVKTVFIDDCRFADPGADVVINSNILALEKTKMHNKDHTRYFLGPRYFIFDEDDRRKPPQRIEGRQNVILTFGGSDPTGMTTRVLNVVRRLRRPPTALFRVILGPGFREAAAVRSLVRTHSDIEVVVCPSDIIPYFLGSDLAVCAGGRTMYELFCLNKRFIPIATAKHEAEAVRAFMDRRLTPYGLPVWDPRQFTAIMEEYFSREAIH